MAEVAIILCGALGREISDLVQKHGWQVDLHGISSTAHLYPATIAPLVEEKIHELLPRYSRLIVAYGDCGTYGVLDAMLKGYPSIQRLPGPHCYEMYAGTEFENSLAEQPGTFFLTDFLVRAFHGSVIKGLGLDRFPELKSDYFQNYTRLVYLQQIQDPSLVGEAQAIAEYLHLPLTIVHTGYGDLEERLIQLIDTP